MLKISEFLGESNPSPFLFSPLGFVLWHSSVQESRETEEEEEECLLIQDREREEGGKGDIVLLSTSLLSGGGDFHKACVANTIAK